MVIYHVICISWYNKIASYIYIYYNNILFDTYIIIWYCIVHCWYNNVTNIWSQSIFGFEWSQAKWLYLIDVTPDYFCYYFCYFWMVIATWLHQMFHLKAMFQKCCPWTGSASPTNESFDQPKKIWTAEGKWVWVQSWTSSSDQFID